MEISQIAQTLIEFAPAITALIGVLVSLVVGIKRIKNNNNQTCIEIKRDNDKTVKELKEANENLVKLNEELRNENAELRDDNAEFKKALRDFIDRADKEKANVIIRKRKK